MEGRVDEGGLYGRGASERTNERARCDSQRGDPERERARQVLGLAEREPCEPATAARWATILDGSSRDRGWVPC